MRLIRMTNEVFPRIACKFLAAVFALVLLFSCKQRTFNADSEDSDLLNVENVSFNRIELLRNHRFERITPTGERIFAAALEWMKKQQAEADRYAMPAQCANNVSRVFEMAGITSYSSPLLADMVNAARLRGGWVIPLPRETRAIAKVLEQYFSGAVPVGTLVSGCLRPDCSGQAGDGHISLVGDIDSNDHQLLYHNNWYRPEDRPWRPHMIPLGWYQQGYKRKWMPTPWLSRQRDNQGILADVGIVIPEIDDLDPTNYHVTLTVIPEILKEMKNAQALATDGAGAVMPFRPHVAAAGQPIPVPTQPPLAECKKLTTISPTPTNLRDVPNGKILCKIPLGTSLERLSVSGSWTQVKGPCVDGRIGLGYVLSALVVPACE
ncbi:MAG: hypothetical protein ACO3A4_09935 [Silvanigrellaceae bacterium]